MRKLNWIKMGNKVVRLAVVGTVILIGVQSNNKKIVIETENYSFNETLGVSSNTIKKEQKKTETKKTTTKKTTQKKMTTTKKTTTKTTAAKVSSNATKLTGDITGYAANCPKCNGHLACKRSYNVYKNGVVTYPDKTYGTVRIVASSKNLPCGSIVKFNMKSISSKPVVAIVLDRGVLGNDLDLLMPTEKDAYKKVGRKKTTYEVLRRGW